MEEAHAWAAAARYESRLEGGSWTRDWRLRLHELGGIGWFFEPCFCCILFLGERRLPAFCVATACMASDISSAGLSGV